MPYLFDTDAISEVLKPRPAKNYVRWLGGVPRQHQFTSAVVMGELYKGAFRSSAVARHLGNIERRVLPAVTVLPYDLEAARVYGQIRARLESAGRLLADADLQIAATALVHDLELVTFAPGDILVAEGAPGDSLFILSTGSVKAYVRNPKGHYVRVHTLVEGDFFGEISVLTGKPRTATLIAASDCEVLELKKDKLDALTKTHPQVREVLQKFRDERARSTIEAMMKKKGK